MSIYGTNILAKKAPEELNLPALSESEQLAVMYRIWDNLLESADEDEDEDSTISEMAVFIEGANIDSWKSYKAAKKQFKEASKRAKKCIKSGDAAGAKAAIKDGKKALDDFEKCLKNVDSDNVGSAVLGLFANGLLQMAYSLFPFLGGFAGGTMVGAGGAIAAKGMADAMANFGATADNAIKAIDTGAKVANAGVKVITISTKAAQISRIVALVKDIIAFVDALKNRKDESIAGKLNLFRNKMFLYLKEMRKCLDRIEKSIK